MSRTSDLSFNRKALSSSEFAVCVHCMTEFKPSEIKEWIDGDPAGRTALCPFCEIDAIVGFNSSIDARWVAKEHRKRFG
jgi:hypothetical protein